VLVDRRRVVEVHAGDGAEDGPGPEVRPEPEHQNTVLRAADNRVQRPAVQQDPVAGYGGAAERDLVRHALAVGLEQLPRVRLDDDQRPAIRRRVDAVHVEPGLVDDVARERDRLRRAELAVAADRHLVEELAHRIGEPGGPLRDDDVVHERARGGEVVLRDVGAGPRVVDVAVTGRPPGDEQAVALIDRDADRLPSTVRNELRALAVAKVALPDTARRDRPDVERVSIPDRDALGLPVVRQVDVIGTFRARGDKR
jgi:hypothetical protein